MNFFDIICQHLDCLSLGQTFSRLGFLNISFSALQFFLMITGPLGNWKILGEKYENHMKLTVKLDWLVGNRVNRRKKMIIMCAPKATMLSIIRQVERNFKIDLSL